MDLRAFEYCFNFDYYWIAGLVFTLYIFLSKFLSRWCEFFDWSCLHHIWQYWWFPLFLIILYLGFAFIQMVFSFFFYAKLNANELYNCVRGQFIPSWSQVLNLSCRRWFGLARHWNWPKIWGLTFQFVDAFFFA